MRRIAFVVLAASLSGCAVKNTLHVHPATGEIRNCSASGWGWVGTPMALAMHGSCTDTLRSIGFIPMTEVEPGMLSIDSTPPGAQILAGPTERDMRPIGTTPLKFQHPQKSRSWAAECFQLKLAGYQDSKIDCRGPVWGDRIVTVTLEK
jgi:hypothetical protein